ncbi:hypothetical protein HELRODRAFT_162575 [Helobdella robusta]|uniref:C2H2-type domain-containing protein n=1 Tax=Helobdella robusta TaxID=6412 RepID=T1ESV0_HELRO|nr:hypothetical protein HELRODRAFT_162575 [Helobdella robusta]ESN99088.1 hypothetical protein HELRODRAFT_162575 [Helobdella robusta]
MPIHISSLHCLYCEKLFKDNFALKEHMRKKKHKRLRASNKFYFKFFINKHLEANNVADTPDKKENINSDDEDDDTDGEHFNGSHHCLQMKSSFSDWVEDLTSSPSNSVHCLFCRSNFQSSSESYQHLLVKHQFDLLKIRSGLSYYQCIKLINYIRRKVIEAF